MKRSRESEEYRHSAYVLLGRVIKYNRRRRRLDQKGPEEVCAEAGGIQLGAEANQYNPRTQSPTLEIDNGRSEANPPNNKFKKPHDATSKLPVYSSQVRFW